MINNTDEAYKTLLRRILEVGKEKGDRTGTGTISIFSHTLEMDMADGFPLLTTKKMFTKGITHELLWFLNGDTNIQYLVKNGVNIWTPDAYREYCNQFKIYPVEDIDIDYMLMGHADQVMGHTKMEKPNPSYKLGQINAFLEGKAPKPSFYLTIDEFKEKIKFDDAFALKWGELGPIYGKQWVDWNGHEIISSEKINGLNIGVNQIQQAIDTLKNNPDSRRIIVNAWNVDEIDKMALPPCHWAFELYTEELTLDERIDYWHSETDVVFCGGTVVDHYLLDSGDIPKRKISLKWHQRSVDTFLGLPFNIASYGLLLEMFAQQCNMIPDKLVGDLTNVHIYKNHIEQCTEQLERQPMELCKLELGKADDIFSYGFDNFKFVDYHSHPAIKGKISV